MALTIIEGDVGSGKTLLLTIWAKTLIKKPIVSNFKLIGIDYTPFDVNDFLTDKYENCAIFLDELYAYIDSRNSGSEQSKLFSYKLFQGRKKTLDIYGTLQIFNTIDVRYRRMVSYFINSYVYKKNDVPVYFEYHIYHRKKQKTVIKILRNKNAIPFYKMYDTKEVITPNIQKNYMRNNELVGKDKFERIKKIAEDIVKFSSKDITHGTIYLFLSKEKIPRLYEPEIYAYMDENNMLKQKSKKKTTKKKKSSVKKNNGKRRIN